MLDGYKMPLLTLIKTKLNIFKFQKMKNKNTSVALSNPTVSNNINMTLNQNDMIDLVIEHQIEILSTKLEELDNQLKLQEERIDTFSNFITKEIITRASVKNDELAIFNKIVKANKLTIKDHSGLNINRYGENTIKIGSFNPICIDNVEHYKDPYNYAKRHTSVSELVYGSICDISIKYTTSMGGLKMEYSTVILPTHEEEKEYQSAMILLLKKKLALKKEYAEVAMSYLEYKYGEKRIKSKIVKASLSKSDEGRGILKMLEGATNIKLLG
jgi:hypothetical protein